MDWARSRRRAAVVTGAGGLGCDSEAFRRPRLPVAPRARPNNRETAPSLPRPEVAAPAHARCARPRIDRRALRATAAPIVVLVNNAASPSRVDARDDDELHAGILAMNLLGPIF